MIRHWLAGKRMSTRLQGIRTRLQCRRVRSCRENDFSLKRGRTNQGDVGLIQNKQDGYPLHCQRHALPVDSGFQCWG